MRISGNFTPPSLTSADIDDITKEFNNNLIRKARNFVAQQDDTVQTKISNLDNYKSSISDKEAMYAYMLSKLDNKNGLSEEEMKYLNSDSFNLAQLLSQSVDIRKKIFSLDGNQNNLSDKEAKYALMVSKSDGKDGISDKETLYLNSTDFSLWKDKGKKPWDKK